MLGERCGIAFALHRYDDRRAVRTKLTERLGSRFATPASTAGKSDRRCTSRVRRICQHEGTLIGATHDPADDEITVAVFTPRGGELIEVALLSWRVCERRCRHG